MHGQVVPRWQVVVHACCCTTARSTSDSPVVTGVSMFHVAACLCSCRRMCSNGHDGACTRVCGRVCALVLCVCGVSTAAWLIYQLVCFLPSAFITGSLPPLCVCVCVCVVYTHVRCLHVCRAHTHAQHSCTLVCQSTELLPCGHAMCLSTHAIQSSKL